MRDSCAELEKLVTTLHSETMADHSFIAGLLEHKNATIGWLRTRQEDDIKALAKLYDDMIEGLSQEIVLLENHLKSFGEPR